MIFRARSNRAGNGNSGLRSFSSALCATHLVAMHRTANVAVSSIVRAHISLRGGQNHFLPLFLFQKWALDTQSHVLHAWLLQQPFPSDLNTCSFPSMESAFKATCFARSKSFWRYSSLCCSMIILWICLYAFINFISVFKLNKLSLLTWNNSPWHQYITSPFCFFSDLTLKADKIFFYQRLLHSRDEYS